MIALLSPAKRLDFDTPPTVAQHSLPPLLDQAGLLMRRARQLSRAEIQQLMGISDDLTELTHQRFQQLQTELEPGPAKQALLAFSGDVYLGLDATSLSAEDLAFAQDHVVILSGLYGYLRPLDLIQPYRLEMGSRLHTERGKRLYDFWGERITEQLCAQLQGHAHPAVINLASKEYFRSVQARTLPGALITPVFKDTKKGRTRTIGAFAKKGRGMMARYLIEHRIDQPEALKDFTGGGYRYREDLSEGNRWVFERPQPPPVR